MRSKHGRKEFTKMSKMMISGNLIYLLQCQMYLLLYLNANSDTPEQVKSNIFGNWLYGTLSSIWSVFWTWRYIIFMDRLNFAKTSDLKRRLTQQKRQKLVMVRHNDNAAPLLKVGS